jgi:hypothetical protein
VKIKKNNSWDHIQKDKRDPHLTSLVNKKRRVKMEAGEEEQKIRLISIIPRSERK